MKLNTILMIAVIIILLLNIILTILEALRFYRFTLSGGATSGRLRGDSGASGPGPDGRIKIGGMWYSVRWIIKGKEGFIYYEETGK